MGFRGSPQVTIACSTAGCGKPHVRWCGRATGRNPRSPIRSLTASRHERVETERVKSFTYEALLKRDKVNLDIFWLKDESLEDSANLPDPDILAREITEDLEAALEQFATIAEDLNEASDASPDFHAEPDRTRITR